MLQSEANARFWWRAIDPAEPAVAPRPAPQATAPVRRPSPEPPARAEPAAIAVPEPPIVPVRPLPASQSPFVDAGVTPIGSPWAQTARNILHGHTRHVIFGLAFMTGALLFAVLTSFGQNARMAEPLSVQIDRAVAQFGYGIREVSVTGQTHTSDREIFDALALDDAVSFLRFDLGAARARIEALPWVATAQVQRLLPDTLRIEIIERRAIAVWAHDGREELIDDTGRVLGRIALRKAPDLPRVQGPAAAVPAADLLKALASHPDLAERLVEARRIGGRRWTLELGGGTLVHLPAGSDTEALARLVELYRRAPRLVTTAQIVDLRMKGRTILSQKPRVSETAVPASASAAAKERI